jgi:hypothetical protein
LAVKALVKLPAEGVPSVSLFCWQENPCEHPIVILKDVRYCDLESLLKYMYAGQVHIKQDQLGRSAQRHIIIRLKS